VNRAVPFLLAQDPLIAVKEILRGPLDSDPKGITNVFPPNVQQDDFLSFRRHNDLAVIDLSASFYAACANLSLDAEKLLLYAIVNTVTERKDINAVLFTSVGANAQTLSGTISLYRSLLRNPGIISAP
jgi:spore germination protein GerM